MLTRRQLRIKVMQAIYAFQKQDQPEIKDLQQFLNQSITQTYVLFLYMAQLLVEVHKLAEYRLVKGQQRHLATPTELNPSRNFVDNTILVKLRQSEALKLALEKRKLKPWHLNTRYIENIYQQIVNNNKYQTYLNESETSLKKDLSILIKIYTDIIAPNDEILDYLEDENITWTDDYPLVNSAMIMFLRKIKPNKEVVMPTLIKDQEDIDFTMNLFKKTILNSTELIDRIEGKTPNWEKDRIAQIDLIIIIMAQCEFLKFSSIPVKVTINEYLEIAKDYSTPKSNIFINGLLDKFSKEFEQQGILNKIGRGLV